MQDENIFEIPVLEQDIYLEFEEKEHIYKWKGRLMESVTTFLDRHKEPFDKEGIAQQIFEKKGTPVKDTLKEWDEGRKEACKLGNKVHEYAEELMKGSKKRLVKDEKLMSYRHAVNKFFAEHPYWIPIAAELQVCLPELELAGTVDAIFYDVTTNEYQLVDWKTSKSIKKKNYFGKYMLEPLDNIEDCNFNLYSLQLHIYKQMLQQIYGITISNCYIIHLKEGGYSQIKAENFEEMANYLIGLK